MKKHIICVIGLTFSLFLAGCGEVWVTPTGKILRDGQPVGSFQRAKLRVAFHPQLEDGSPTRRVFPAVNVNLKEGAFEGRGYDGKGMPVGKYRISVEILSRDGDDTLNGQFGPETSPIVRDITAEPEEIIIDIAKPDGMP